MTRWPSDHLWWSTMHLRQEKQHWNISTPNLQLKRHEDAWNDLEWPQCDCLMLQWFQWEPSDCPLARLIELARESRGSPQVFSLESKWIIYDDLWWFMIDIVCTDRISIGYWLDFDLIASRPSGRILDCLPWTFCGAFFSVQIYTALKE